MGSIHPCVIICKVCVAPFGATPHNSRFKHAAHGWFAMGRIWVYQEKNCRPRPHHATRQPRWYNPHWGFATGTATHGVQVYLGNAGSTRTFGHGFNAHDGVRGFRHVHPGHRVHLGPATCTRGVQSTVPRQLHTTSDVGVDKHQQL